MKRVVLIRDHFWFLIKTYLLFHELIFSRNVHTLSFMKSIETIIFMITVHWIFRYSLILSWQWKLIFFIAVRNVAILITLFHSADRLIFLLFRTGSHFDHLLELCKPQRILMSLVEHCMIRKTKSYYYRKLTNWNILMNRNIIRIFVKFIISLICTLLAEFTHPLFIMLEITFTDRRLYISKCFFEIIHS